MEKKAKLYMNCFGCTVCHFCLLSYVNMEVKVTRLHKDYKKKGGFSFSQSPVAHHFYVWGFWYWQRVGLLLQLLGSIISFCLPLCLILTVHYRRGPENDVSLAEDSIIVVGVVWSGAFLEWYFKMLVLFMGYLSDHPVSGRSWLFVLC